MTNPEQEPIIKLSDQETEDLLEILEGGEKSKTNDPLTKEDADDLSNLFEEGEIIENTPKKNTGIIGIQREKKLSREQDEQTMETYLTENEVDDLLKGLETEKSDLNNAQKWEQMNEAERKKIIIKAWAKLSDIEKKFITSASDEKFEAIMQKYRHKTDKAHLITGIRKYLKANKIELELAA